MRRPVVGLIVVLTVGLGACGPGGNGDDSENGKITCSQSCENVVDQCPDLFDSKDECTGECEEDLQNGEIDREDIRCAANASSCSEVTACSNGGGGGDVGTDTTPNGDTNGGTDANGGTDTGAETSS